MIREHFQYRQTITTLLAEDRRYIAAAKEGQKGAYMLSITDVRWLGAIAPLGGAAFIAGWLCLAWAVWKA